MPLLAGASWKTSSFGSSFQGLRHLEQLIWRKDNWSKTSRSSSGWFRTPRFTGLEIFWHVRFCWGPSSTFARYQFGPFRWDCRGSEHQEKRKIKEEIKEMRERKADFSRFLHSFWRLCPRVPRRTPSSPQSRLAAKFGRHAGGMLTSNSWVLFACPGADQVIEEWCLRHLWLKLWMIVKVVFGLLMVAYSTSYIYHGYCWQAPRSRTPQVSVVVVYRIPQDSQSFQHLVTIRRNIKEPSCSLQVTQFYGV